MFPGLLLRRRRRHLGQSPVMLSTVSHVSEAGRWFPSDAIRSPANSARKHPKGRSGLKGVRVLIWSSGGACPPACLSIDIYRVHATFRSQQPRVFVETRNTSSPPHFGCGINFRHQKRPTFPENSYPLPPPAPAPPPPLVISHNLQLARCATWPPHNSPAEHCAKIVKLNSRHDYSISPESSANLHSLILPWPRFNSSWGCNQRLSIIFILLH